MIILPTAAKPSVFGIITVHCYGTIGYVCVCVCGGGGGGGDVI